MDSKAWTHEFTCLKLAGYYLCEKSTPDKYPTSALFLVSFSFGPSHVQFEHDGHKSRVQTGCLVLLLVFLQHVGNPQCCNVWSTGGVVRVVRVFPIQTVDPERAERWSNIGHSGSRLLGRP